MTDGKIIWLEETGSTNSWLSENEHSLETNTAVAARRQTAGRGQRGNSWESEPGSNLTLSLLLRPEGIHVARSFCLSEAVAVAVAETVEAIAPGIKVAIKWPNDIYVNDSKIAGILIENVISGSAISRSIVGVGLNVNQTEFLSDAPNPVSLKQLLPKVDFNVDVLAEVMVSDILGKVDQALSSECEAGEISGEYFARMWRGDGYYHRYYDHTRGLYMNARIDSVAASGHITLTDQADGVARTYAFKEISAVL